MCSFFLDYLPEIFTGISPKFQKIRFGCMSHGCQNVTNIRFVFKVL